MVVKTKHDYGQNGNTEKLGAAVKVKMKKR
jgi:hypothetical protein